MEFELTVDKGAWRIILKWCGDGVCGKLHTNDEEDYPMLRYFAQKKKNGNYVEVANRLTYLRATDPVEQVHEAAELLLNRLKKFKFSQHEWENTLFFDSLAYLHINNNGEVSIEVELEQE